MNVAGAGGGGFQGRGPDRRRPPPATPLRPVRLPELETFRLSSGLVVKVAEDHRLPELSARLVCEAGALNEGKAPSGVAELTARLLTEGAGGRSAPEMARWLGRLGAAFRASVGYDTATVAMHALPEVLEEALDFLRTVLLRPDFPSDEFERVRQELVDELKRDEDEPETVATRAMLRSIFGNHRCGTPVAGTPATVRGVTLDAVRRFHGEAYGARDATLVVCGDVRPGPLREALESRLGAWDPGRGRRPRPRPVDETVRAGRVLLLDRPGSAQAELRVGAVGAAYGDEDHFAILVANAILGGLFNSRLNMNLREEKGWTYGARTSFHFRRDAGPFLASAAVDSAAAAAALEEFFAEIRGMANDPPGKDELRLARNALALSLPRQFETVSQVSRKVATQVIYDLSEDYWLRYASRVEEVSRDDVLEVVERRLDPEALTAVVVADAGEVRTDLEARFGRVDVRSAAPGEAA